MNNNPAQQNSVVELTLRHIIEEITGNNPNDIHLHADLVEDLGISQIELLKIINAAQTKLEISFGEKTKQELLASDTVGDMVEIFEEEYEY